MSTKELSDKKLLEMKESGMSPKEIAKEYGLTPQKVGIMIKKAEYEASKKVEEDEYPIHMFAKESGFVADENVGSSIVMTAREYQEYSEANGRYQGRREGVKTKLDPLELQVNLNTVGSDVSGVDVREHLLKKHGLTIDELKKVAMMLTKEVEISYSDVLKKLGLRP